MYDIQKASLQTDTNAQIQFEHENHQDKENARWNRIGTPPEEMDSSREQVTTWMSKIQVCEVENIQRLDEKDLTFQFSLQVKVGDQEETLKVYTLRRLVCKLNLLRRIHETRYTKH